MIFERRKLYTFIAITAISVVILAFVWEFKKWIDIAWGVELTYLIDSSKYDQAFQNDAERKVAFDQAITIIKNNISRRVNALSLWDTEIKTQVLGGNNYLIVKIWWAKDIEAAKQSIWKTVELEFKAQNKAPLEQQRIDRKNLAQTYFAQLQWATSLQAAGTGKTSQDIYYEVLITTWLNLPYAVSWQRLAIRAVNGVFPTLIQWVYATWTNASWAAAPIAWFFIINNAQSEIVTTWQLSGQRVYALEMIFIKDTQTLVPAKDPTNGQILNGAYFKQATVTQSQLWKPVVTIEFNSQWKDIFCNLSQSLIWQPLAIVVGWNVITSPVIREKICQWQAQIDGWFDKDSAKKLKDDLNEWALPAALILSDQKSVWPTLWNNAWIWAQYAAALSLVLIFILLWFMYWPVRAALSILTIVVFLTILLAIFKISWYALSLSGISAIILNIGMWVDASILIFERLDEELARWRKYIDAVNEAYTRSRTPIFDGNVSSLLIWLIMAVTWSDIFQWFGITMIIATAILLFVCVPLTHILLHLKK